MGEVKRYHVTEAGLVEGHALGRINVVLGSDHDRISADADRLRAELECSRGDFAQLERIRDALQQRLTASDERADTATSLIQRIVANFDTEIECHEDVEPNDLEHDQVLTEMREFLAGSKPAAQPQGEPVGWQIRSRTDRPDSVWTEWRECSEMERAMHSHEVGKFNRFGIMREIRPLYATRAAPAPLDYGSLDPVQRLAVCRGDVPGAAPVIPELTPELRWILGQMCFQHIHTAQALRLMGHQIARKAEDEQAVTIYWMLGHYLKDPANWRQNASAEMKAAGPAA